MEIGNNEINSVETAHYIALAVFHFFGELKTEVNRSRLIVSYLNYENGQNTQKVKCFGHLAYIWGDIYSFFVIILLS